jgi:hypothetical protein
VVRLEQPQYQSAELLIAVLARGFRVSEVPATIHKRQVGESKKGHNAIYGLRYAGVVLGTWARERWRRGPVAPTPSPARTGAPVPPGSTAATGNGAAAGGPPATADATSQSAAERR